MKIDIYSASGTKSGSLDLPSALFEAPIKQGLMHLVLVRQQSNRRHPIAHVKTRGEVVGSTKKLFQQKGTGNARRGPIRSPVMRGGGKAFGPRNDANFQKNMPKKMRRAALFSCLSLKAKEGSIVGLENYPETVKTKALSELLTKMKLELGRRIVIVLPEKHRSLELSARNIPRVKTITAQYLNPEDLLLAKHVVFLVDAVKVAEEVFGRKDGKEGREAKDAKEKNTKSTTTKNTKKTLNKKSSASSAS